MRPILTLALLLIAAPALAQSRTQTLELDAVTGATAYEVEQSTDNGATWTMLPSVPPSACPSGRCVVTVTPPAGRTLYRWAVVSGTTRVLRTDAGVYACVGLPDCPFGPSGVGVR